MNFGVDGEKKFLQHFSVRKNGTPLGKIAKWKVLSYPRRQQQNEKKIVATNTDQNGFVRSVKLMLDTSGRTDIALQYLERPVNKLVMLVENE